jgi:GT2 family glycosyltransferase
VTRNRSPELRRTLGKLAELEEKPTLMVIDNGSSDDSPAMVRSCFPAAGLISLPRNRGPWARNLGVARSATEYVAFSDDDSWWEPGALRTACALLDANPGVGLVAGRTLVGPDAAEDPLNAVLASSPLSREGLPGPRVLGFLGCAAVVRRAAFLEAGGYCGLLGIGGEEELLAADLAAAGHHAVYAPDVIARHYPSPVRDVPARQATERRNQVLTSWLRRPAGHALASTASLAGLARGDLIARRALTGVVRSLPRALARRRRLPPHVEADLLLLETHARQVTRDGGHAIQGRR